MSTNGKRAAGQQARFIFNFHECHAPDVPRGGWAGPEEFVAQLRGRDWEPQPGTGDLSGSCDPDFATLNDLKERTRDYFAEEGQPDEVVDIPFAKLAALMRRDGWAFAGGDFMEFEGNHNDTEITVVLKKKSKPRKAAQLKKAAKPKKTPRVTKAAKPKTKSTGRTTRANGARKQ